MPALYDLLVTACATDPQRTLLSRGDVDLTYGEILAGVHHGAQQLEARGVRPASRVAVLSDLDAVEFLLAALTLSLMNCSIVPIETTEAEEGRARRLGVQWLLADRSGRIAPWPTRSRAPAGRSFGEEVVLSTSGSTDAPKDVPVHAGGLLRLARHGRDSGRVLNDDRVAQLYQPTFDPYFGTLAFVLAVGAAMVQPVSREALALSAFVARRDVTVLDCVPHQLRVASVMRMAEPGSMAALRVVQIGGERLSPELAEIALAAAPNARVFNVYGPTEATVSSTEHELTRDAAASEFYRRHGVPIGTALPGVTTFVADLDGSGHPVTPGEVGELWLSGPQVIDGYCDPADDAARFSTGEDGTRWYRTGDHVRSSPRGLIFEARSAADQKVAGRRIDLGRVEDAVRSHYNGREAAAVICDGRLLVMVALPQDADLAANGPSLRVLPSSFVPGLRSYAVPSLVAACAEVPRLRNGKRDTRRIIEVLTEQARCAAIPSGPPRPRITTRNG